QNLPELGLAGDLGIEVERLGIHRQRGESEVVGLCHCAGEPVLHAQAHGQLLEPAAPNTVDVHARKLSARASRWSGAAMAMSASDRSRSDLPARRATPCSVTTTSTVWRGMVTAVPAA